MTPENDMAVQAAEMVFAMLLRLGPETAAKIVANAMGKFEVHPLKKTGPGDVWAGIAVLHDYEPEGVLRRTAWFGGPVQDLGAWIENERQRFIEGGRPSDVVRVFLANASRAARFVLIRARELGLPEGEV